MRVYLSVALLGGLWFVMAGAGAACTGRGPLPDPTCTPGVTNPQVTPETMGATICVRGWTATIRPSAAYTTALKVRQMAEYGLTLPLAAVEEDHLISLELGGHPSDPSNLWPQAWVRPDGWGAHTKDHLENWLKLQVCDGTLPLAVAQDAIATDWVAAYRQYIGEPTP